MRARFLNDEEAGQTVSAENRPLLEARTRISDGKVSEFWVYPRGCEVSGEVALHIASSGQGVPTDDECQAACGMSPHELAVRQLNYEMTAKGVNDPGDRTLYRAGVISGYDDHREYIHGPNWDKYHANLAAKKTNEEEE